MVVPDNAPLTIKDLRMTRVQQGNSQLPPARSPNHFIYLPQEELAVLEKVAVTFLRLYRRPATLNLILEEQMQTKVPPTTTHTLS